MKIYTVREKDTVRSIAECHGIAPQRLAEDNGIGIRERLIVGEELLIGEPTRTVYARRGDSIEGIARRYGVDVRDLCAYNPELALSKKLYEGQTLAIKYCGGRYGVGIGNGYYYEGCDKEKIMMALPYLSYITVSGAVLEGGSIRCAIDDGMILEIARREKKIAHLRIVLSEVPEKESYGRFAASALLLAKTRGYSGIALSGIDKMEYEDCKELLLELRRAFLECDMRVFVEESLERSLGVGEYADGVVLRADKLDMPRVPSFDEWDAKYMKGYAEGRDALRTFIDLSGFGYMNGEYIPKCEILPAARRGKAELSTIAEGDITVATVGAGQRERAVIFEGLSNTYKKLLALSELGYYGLSFDIGRCNIAELLMFGIMFSKPISI